MRTRAVAIGVAVAVLVPAAAAGSPLPGAPACPMFPADSFWHARVDTLPVDPRSAAYIANAGANSGLHPDFGAGLYEGRPMGIPSVTVAGTQPRVPVTFAYSDESDPGPYPIPANAPIEGGPTSTGDRHVLVVDRDACRLYETFASYPLNGGSAWYAGSGAIFDLNSNAMRPRTWTSADAAGLPILPGLVRYEEVAAGEIDHPIRITLPRTDRRYVWPARHQAGINDATAAPMGAWLRLKANVNISAFPSQSRVILRALQEHGAIVADNGSAFYITGSPDDRWNNDDLHQLGGIRGSDFEFVDSSALMTDPDSGRVSTIPLPTDIPGGLTIDGFGGLHRFVIGAGQRLGLPRGGPYWNGWDIARGVAVRPDRFGGYVLDGFGGLHGFRLGSTTVMPPAPSGAPYWNGWDITRGVALLPNGTGGYVLDGFGGLHPFRIGAGPMPPHVTSGPYWNGWDIARGVTLAPDGRRAYVVDAYGGVHRVAFGGAALPPRPRSVFSTPGIGLTRGIALLRTGTGGYTVDQLGGLHPFAVGATNVVAPPALGSATWTWSIARSVGL